MGFIRGVTDVGNTGEDGAFEHFLAGSTKAKAQLPLRCFSGYSQPRNTSGSDGSDQPVDEPYLPNLVVQDCGSCHGLTLVVVSGPPLRPENLDHLPVDAIAAIIREGVPGSAMPPWKPLLAPEEIHWISRQLKSGALISP